VGGRGLTACALLGLQLLAAGCSPAVPPGPSIDLKPIDAAGLRALREGPARGVRLVNVWATWCGPCVRELPELSALERSLAARGLDLVTVAANFPDEREEALRILEKAGASGRSFIFGSDRKYDLMEALDPEWEGGLPYTLLIKPRGEVVFRKMGEVDLADLRARIEAALGGP
jgi:thiol-disulfide isomerase/thioredoxin